MHWRFKRNEKEEKAYRAADFSSGVLAFLGEDQWRRARKLDLPSVSSSLVFFVLSSLCLSPASPSSSFHVCFYLFLCFVPLFSGFFFFDFSSPPPLLLRPFLGFSWVFAEQEDFCLRFLPWFFAQTPSWFCFILLLVVCVSVFFWLSLVFFFCFNSCSAFPCFLGFFSLGFAPVPPWFFPCFCFVCFLFREVAFAQPL